MFAVNSVCHAFGSQPFATGDESRNNRIVAALAFGEGWHNNHHAFPSAAFHGMGRQPDVTGLVIRGARARRPRLGRPPADRRRRRSQARPGLAAGVVIASSRPFQGGWRWLSRRDPRRVRA